jgi:hypothetical protein
MTDVFGSLAMAVTRALDRDLPDIEFERRVYPKNADGAFDTETVKRRPHINDVSVYHFLQSWGNTSIGFGGVAGQAFTNAYTTVVTEAAGDASVYMGGRFAYSVEKPTARFFEDLRNFQMAGAADHARRKVYSEVSA